MPRRTAYAAVALTATATLLAGCGGSSGGTTSTSNSSSLAAASELTSAVQSLGNASTLTATLKLGASGSQLLSFAKAQDKATKLTAQQAATIAGLSLTFEVSAPSGKTLDTMTGGLSNEGAANISVNAAGKSLVAIRVVNKTLYVQADLKDLLNDLGKASTYRQISAAAGQLPGFIGALVQGKWVSLSLASLKGLSGSLGAAPSTSSSSKQHQLLTELEGLLTKDVTVTRTSSGSTDNLQLTANLRTLAGDITSTFSSAVPGAGAALSSTKLGNVPDKNVTLNATVTSGALSSVTFDLGQLAKSGQGTLPITLSFARSGAAITAPSGAVQADLQQLGSLLGAFGSGLSSGG